MADRPRPQHRRTRLTARGRIVVAIVAAVAIFGLGVAVGGALRDDPGQPHLLTGTADVHVVTVTETIP